MHTSLFGILTAVIWAAADIFIAQSTKTIRPVFGAALVSLIGTAIFCVYYLLFIQSQIPANISGVAWSAVSGVFIFMASVFFFKALHGGPIGLISALSSTYPAITLIVAITMFDAALSLRQSIGFAMVIAGVVAAAGFHTSAPSTEKSGAAGTLMALLAALSWGIGYGLLAEGVKLLGWQAASLVQFAVLGTCCLALIILTLRRYQIDLAKMKSAVKSPFILGSAVTQQGGAILLNIGLHSDASGGSIVVALSSCYPILTTIMAYFLYNERIPLLALGGGALAIAGIVLLSV
ncbi:MAG TPA: EamA family transporter [Chryseolinea sp.]